MKLWVAAVGRTKEKRLRALADDYLARLAHYLPTEVREVREGRGSGEQRKEQEWAALRAALPSDCVVVAMDERGRNETSEELSAWIGQLMVAGTRNVAFVIGGADGLPELARQEADDVLALSRLTLPHELARVLLCEQLYRAMTIIRAEPYHR